MAAHRFQVEGGSPRAARGNKCCKEDLRAKTARKFPVVHMILSLWPFVIDCLARSWLLSRISHPHNCSPFFRLRLGQLHRRFVSSAKEDPFLLELNPDREGHGGTTETAAVGRCVCCRARRGTQDPNSSRCCTLSVRPWVSFRHFWILCASLRVQKPL